MNKDEKSLQIVVRNKSAVAPGASPRVLVSGKQFGSVATAAVTKAGDHSLPAGAVTGWSYCTFHACACTLPKACYLPDDHCSFPKVCMHVAHTCDRPKVCTNPTCPCGAAKMLDEHHGSCLQR